MLLRARIVLPVSRPAIQDGGVQIEGNRIIAVGRWRDVLRRWKGPVCDLGESILLPGLINAHCHLDYTDMAGLLTPKNLPDWIKELVSLRVDWGYSEFAQSWLRGASMLLRTGSTTVADIESIPQLLPEVWSATPLRIWSFLEMTGVKGQRDPGEILEETICQARMMHSPRGGVGLSPHALYSTTPELLERLAVLRRSQSWLVTMHVAESIEEQEMYCYRRGALFRWLKPQRSMADCSRNTPVQKLQQYGLLDERFVAVHANYLTTRDVRILGENRVSVVHCPRSHGFFRHRAFPLKKLMFGGGNVCLGTDSLASIWRRPPAKAELSLFAEMQSLADAPSAPKPAEILKMATQNGARALGMAGQLGELSPGSIADMISIPFCGKVTDPCSAVVSYEGQVSAVLIDGRWAIPPQ